MSLIEQMDLAGKEISTDSYSMSIGELLTMYKDGELELHPEFQRLFRWNIEQKSRLIESLLLGIPIPSVFVSQTDKGTWEVIDGLQRLSTIFELTGDWKDPDGNKREPLSLSGTKYLPAIDGLKWTSEDPDQELPAEAKLRIKRARVDVNIVLSKSDASAKYELFQRLNTGGTEASEQEIRNAILVMTNKNFFDWLSSLSNYPNFKTCIPISERLNDQQYSLELVTRFIILSTLSEEESKNINDIGIFLTDKIVEMALEDSLEKKEKIEFSFRRTFDSLADILGGSSFKKFDATKEQSSGQVLISLFEVIAIGLGYYAGSKDYLISEDKIREAQRNTPQIPKFISYSGSGVRASTRIPNTIEIGRELFAP